MPIRIDVESLRRAKIAAAYKGITVMEYASQVLREAADRDIEEGHKAQVNPSPPKPRRPRGGD